MLAINLRSANYTLGKDMNSTIIPITIVNNSLD